jgi:FtsH-binding integral membrane protein
MWVIAFAPLGIVLWMSFGLAKMSASKAQTLFWVFAGLMGASLSSIFMVYVGASIARVFFITAATFATMSLYGYTTKSDLTKLGSFLMMGLLGVIIFVGLTAYDTQKIKDMYFDGGDSETMAKKSIMGALTLYLDFINLFVMLLRFFGQRRD